MDYNNLTDEQIIELTSVVFTTSDSSEVLMPLEDIKIIDASTIELSGNIYKIKQEEVRKIVIKKGKYNLMKAKIDTNSVNRYIEDTAINMVDSLMSKYATELQLNSSILEERIKTVNIGITDLSNMISTNRSAFTEISHKFSNIEDNVTKVVKELKVLIEE